MLFLIARSLHGFILVDVKLSQTLNCGHARKSS
jgi:hypothetical protein